MADVEDGVGLIRESLVDGGGVVELTGLSALPDLPAGGEPISGR
jgi:hypothetical protein